MTTAIVHRPRRNWLPALSLLLAGSATVLGVVAITSDDVGTTTPAQTPAPASATAQSRSHTDVPVYRRMPAGWPATEVMRQEAEARARWQHDAELMPSGWPATQVMQQAAHRAP